MKTKKIPIFLEVTRNSFFIIILILIIYTVSQLVTFWMFTDEYERDLLQDRYEEVVNLSKNINVEFSKKGFYEYLQELSEGENDEYIRIYSSDRIYYESPSEIWSGISLDNAGKDTEIKIKIFDFEIYNLITGPLEIGDSKYTIQIIREDDIFDEFITNSLPILVLTSILGLVLSGVGATYVSKNFINRLRKLITTMNEIKEKGIDKRAEISELNDEIDKVNIVFNSMMDELEEAFHEQSRFVADASHELKTPLTRLQLSTALVRHQTGDIEPVKRIEKEIQRMDKMISELLLISRQQMHSQMEHNLFSIDQLWDDVIKDALFEAEQRKITCDVNISILHPEKHMIYGNLSLLTSAIENIVRNALKYTKDRIFLTINLQKNEQDENCLQIRVDDNGLGLPPEEFDKIFKPFYRVDETRTRATGGTGLGLTIVYNVVNEHHGKVWAESSNLGGLAVTIQLPLWKQS